MCLLHEFISYWYLFLLQVASLIQTISRTKHESIPHENEIWSQNLQQSLGGLTLHIEFLLACISN